MAKITLDDLERYGNWLDGIAVDAEGSFRSAVLARYREMESELGDISGWDRKHVGELRDFATDVIVDIWNTHGDASSSIGSMFFEQTLGEDMPETAVMADYVNAEQAAASARYWAKNLFGEDADVDAFVGGCSRFVNRVVSHSADMQTIDQAVEEASRGKRIKYARVPVGPTCGFCIMLASRGFVYATKKSAGDDGGAFNRFHDYCNCRVVAGYDGLEVEGYDYKGMYRRYRQCRDTIGDTEAVWQDWQSLTQEERDSYGKGARAIPLSEDPDEDARLRKRLGAQADAFGDYLTHRICQEMDTRDRQWLYDGTVPEITFETPELERQIRNKRGGELETAARLARHGVPPAFRVDTRVFYDSEKGLWQKVGLADLQNGYEIKTLSNAGWSSVDGYLRRIAKKEDVRAAVIDNFGNKNPMTDAELITRLQEQKRWNGPIYVITHDDEYVLVPAKSASRDPRRVQMGRDASIAHAASSTEEHRSPKPTTGVRPLGGVPGETGSAGAMAAHGKTQGLRVNWPSVSATAEEVAAAGHDFIGPEQWQPRMTVVQAPTGPVTPKDYSLLSGKGKRKLKDNEVASHDLFESYGFGPVALPEDRSASANIDLVMTVNGETHYWELKDPEKGDRAQRKLTSEGVSKWRRIQGGTPPEIIEMDELGSPRIAIDNRFNDGQSDHDALRRLVNDMAYYADAGLDEAILVLKDGTVVHFER